MSSLRDRFDVLGVPRGADKLHPPRPCRAAGITQFLRALSAQAMPQHCVGIKHPARVPVGACAPLPLLAIHTASLSSAPRREGGENQNSAVFLDVQKFEKGSGSA